MAEMGISPWNLHERIIKVCTYLVDTLPGTATKRVHVNLSLGSIIIGSKMNLFFHHTVGLVGYLHNNVLDINCP